MWVFIVLASIFLALFWYKAIKPFSYWKKRGVNQGKPVWLFGHSLSTILKTESIADFTIRFYNASPDARYMGIYEMTSPLLMITDPDLLKQVTVKDFDHFVDHSNFLPDDTDPYWSKNLFALRGQQWKEMRPILSPSFTSSKMRSIFVLMSDCVEDLVKHYLKNQLVVEVEMKDICTRYANDIIASAAFGVKVDSFGQPKNEFYLMGKEATDFTGFWKNLKFLLIFMIPKIAKLFSLRLFSREVSNFFQQIVDETVKTREEKGIVRPDMIHLLMEARKGNNKAEESSLVDTGFATVDEADIGKVDVSSKGMEITNVDIAAQALIFFFAGFDTVTNVMSFMAYELAVNPDIQDRLRREIVETKEKCGGKLNYEALMKMKYMDMVVSETLRKWPDSPVVDRVCTKPYVIEPKKADENPIHLDKEFIIWIPILGFHRDPKYYPNPDKFDPERFNDENKKNINPYTYLPFGVGPRNCIGSRFALMEMKILFFHLLDTFEIVPTEKTTIPIKLNKSSFSVTAENGFHMGFKQLNKSKRD